MKKYYDLVNIVYLHDYNCYGSIEKMGAYASVVKYEKDGLDVEELMSNEDFAIVDEIVFEHVEEEE